jgi:pimeloyl-ACP methyl ester carboxylesterase
MVRSAVVKDGSSKGRRRAEVEAAFRTLHERYLGAPPGFDAAYELRLGDLGVMFEVRCTEHGVRVLKGSTRRTADVVIGTDSETWLALRRGELSGLDAFQERRLYARGQVDLALAFEGLFELPGGRPPLVRIHDVPVLGGRCISTLTTGEGPDVVLLHGLGAAKTSFFDTIAVLRRAGYRVHAIDLPGFGSSPAPLIAPYTARWFAAGVVEWMDALGIDRAHMVGNSLGGRVALEVGLHAPERVGGLVLLAPAVAFIRRGLHPVVRVLRPELGFLPHKLRRAIVAGQLWSMFADPDALDPTVADIAVDEFQRTYASAAARIAFFASARNIYLDAPFGRDGFYPRLTTLQPPALFVWGTQDTMIPAAFRHHVRQWLPRAEQVVLTDCGHVPQIERADEVIRLIRRHLGSAAAGRRVEGAPEAPVVALRGRRAA